MGASGLETLREEMDRDPAHLLDTTRAQLNVRGSTVANKFLRLSKITDHFHEL